ncbi:VOC family protein [Alteromonas aestuariivivens]|uniref:VOC family protein n=1 Tax=Alteromonas aestuariivivens TaxID=1938339 RepID=A0A3D8MEJ3_9ALTE|nr:VOC family protein [Alteromonas aestuariivivens]RDV29036.1 VOC family protein [Alteromonas aestuariivivens]
MELGQFSVSLAVKDIRESLTFYQALGFQALQGCGSVEEKWLILQNGSTVIGLFEGMFEHNILTFNPADVRAIEQQIKARGIRPDVAVEGDTGPGHCILTDPDGNRIMFDQF